MPTDPCVNRRRCLAAAGALALAAGPRLLCAQEPSVYRFSPVNQYGLELTAQYWNPIIDYVSARTGVRMSLKIGRTSADTTAYALANEVELLFSNHLFSHEREKLGWRVFGRRDAPPIQGQVAVLANSPIQRLEDLEGKVVAFPGPEAVVAYKFPYAELHRRGVNVQVVFGGNMDGAFAQLLSGKAQAVGTQSQLSAGWSKRENVPLRVLWATEPLHDLALMASRKVPDKVMQALARAFVDMGKDPEGQRVLAAVSEVIKLPQLTRFIASNGSEYAPYRAFYQTAPAMLR